MADLPPADRLDPRWSERAARLARSIVGDSAAADDVVGEAALIAIGKGARPDEADRWPWFAQVVVHTARNQRRADARRARRNAVAGAQLNAVRTESAGGPEQAAISAEECERILAALDGLPGPERDALISVQLAGVPIDEAAAEAGVSPVGLKSRLKRGRRRLRRRLGPAGRSGAGTGAVGLGAIGATTPDAPGLVGQLLVTTRGRTACNAGGAVMGSVALKSTGAGIAALVAVAAVLVAMFAVVPRQDRQTPGPTAARNSSNAAAGHSHEAGGTDARSPDGGTAVIDAGPIGSGPDAAGAGPGGDAGGTGSQPLPGSTQAQLAVSPDAVVSIYDRFLRRLVIDRAVDESAAQALLGRALRADDRRELDAVPAGPTRRARMQAAIRTAVARAARGRLHASISRGDVSPAGRDALAGRLVAGMTDPIAVDIVADAPTGGRAVRPDAVLHPLPAEAAGLAPSELAADLADAAALAQADVDAAARFGAPPPELQMRLLDPALHPAYSGALLARLPAAEPTTTALRAAVRLRWAYPAVPAAPRLAGDVWQALDAFIARGAPAALEAALVADLRAQIADTGEIAPNGETVELVEQWATVAPGPAAEAAKRLGELFGTADQRSVARFAVTVGLRFGTRCRQRLDDAGFIPEIDRLLDTGLTAGIWRTQLAALGMAAGMLQHHNRPVPAEVADRWTVRIADAFASFSPAGLPVDESRESAARTGAVGTAVRALLICLRAVAPGRFGPLIVTALTPVPASDRDRAMWATLADADALDRRLGTPESRLAFARLMLRPATRGLVPAATFAALIREARRADWAGILAEIAALAAAPGDEAWRRRLRDALNRE
jgi:RNA polymerase sigma factor (sigma-70 family)